MQQITSYKSILTKAELIVMSGRLCAFIAVLFAMNISVYAQSSCYSKDSASLYLHDAMFDLVNTNEILEPVRTEPFTILVVFTEKQSNTVDAIAVVSASEYYSEIVYVMLDSISHNSLQNIEIRTQKDQMGKRMFIQPFLFNHTVSMRQTWRDLTLKFDLCSPYYYDKSVRQVINMLQTTNSASLLPPILMERSKVAIR